MPSHTNHRNKYKPYMVTVRRCVVPWAFQEGLEKAGFEIKGAVSQPDLTKDTINILFPSSFHGKQVMAAFRPPDGKISIPPNTEHIIVEGAQVQDIDEEPPALMYRDKNKPIPLMEDIRDCVLMSYKIASESGARVSGVEVVGQEGSDELQGEEAEREVEIEGEVATAVGSAQHDLFQSWRFDPKDLAPQTNDDTMES